MPIRALPFLGLLAAIVLTISSCSNDSAPGKVEDARQGRPAKDRPNVIVYFLDDSGYGDLAHHGNPTIETPTISRLARDGADFTQFYVTSPACSASRYSLLTGRYPARSGFGNWVLGPNHPRHLHVRELTLAEGLKSRGYATGLFGKWHLGTPNARNEYSQQSLPLAHGFDTWLGTDVSHDYGTARLITSDPKGSDPLAGYRVLGRDLRTNDAVAKTLTARYTDAALEFIEANHERPFFAYIAPNQPHLGLYCSDEFEGVSRRGLLGDVMAEIDDSLDRILRKLDERGIAGNTLIIFSSDNGPWIRFQKTASHPAYGEARLHVGYALPFRDGKGSTWEGGVRVPGVFYWPGVIEGRRVLSPASTLDILPTVFELCGVDLPEDRSLDGRKILSLLSARWKTRGTPSPGPILFSLSRNKFSAVRAGPWKLHRRIYSQTGNQYGFTASEDQPLLFQVERDLGERFDRALERPKIVEDLMRAIRTTEKAILDEGNFWTR